MTLKYTASEAMNEVLARRDQVRRKRERRRTALYGACVCAILVVLTLTGLGAKVSSGPNGGAGAEAMGSFLLEARTGGLLAVLILTAVLIVLAALLFLRHRRNREPNDDRTDRKSE